MSKVVSRSPAELTRCAFIDVDAVDAREHRPSAPGVYVFVTWHPPPHNHRCIRAKLLQVIARERRRRAHDVAAEPDGLHPLQRAKMCADDVLKLDPPV